MSQGILGGKNNMYKGKEKSHFQRKCSVILFKYQVFEENEGSQGGLDKKLRSR